ncbi:DUF2066 domain-containing protein [Azomonas macrocytogenes]|uniref:DUF2066 domain-containing protein n=1 Tax=Azomonas macrocytogenes TaxID=69962 RepID=A0A839T1J1_AZOMA|nr:DUF2066 domain-containing protein [Azomonas macrocytogenes]MBB3102264.1 hypothetical protein [Azomonas macrocytogenes]
MRSIVPYLVLCSALMPLVPAVAKPMEGLYRVREPFSAQEPNAHDEGLRRAFDTLVLRLTGNPDAATSPALASLRSNPQQLITQYGVENDILMVEFDPATVQRSLRQAGMGTWGAERPSLLTWWLSESSQGTQLAGDDQESGNLLRTAAQYRGLPLLLPLADLDEQLAVTPEVVQTGNVGVLREASSRYDANALLAVAAREAETGGWQATWQLWLANKEGKGEVSAANPQALADAVMVAVNGYLAPQFVARPEATQALRLEVRGANISRFAELDRLLEPMNGELIVVEGDRLVYRLQANPEQLRTQLAMARLQEVPAPPPPPPAQQAPTVNASGQPVAAPLPPPSEGTGTLLHYRW